MTKQNAIHKYVRESNQYRKKFLRKSSGKRIPHHTRKWWKVWLRRWESEYFKEKEGIE